MAKVQVGNEIKKLLFIGAKSWIGIPSSNSTISLSYKYPLKGITPYLLCLYLRINSISDWAL